MAFRVKHGGPTAYAKLAQLAGEAKKAQRDEAINLQMIERLRREQSDQRMLEMRQKFGEAAEIRAHEWELEKMMLRSQSDFAMEEEERRVKKQYVLAKELKEQQKFDAAIEAVEETELLSKKEKEDYILKLTIEHLTGRSFEQEDPTKRLLANMMRGSQGVVAPQPQAVGDVPPKPTNAPPDAVWNPQHRRWTIIRDGRLKGID